MPTLTCTYCPISQHAFGAWAAAIGAKVIEALDAWETGLPFTLINIFQARHTCQKGTQEASVTDSLQFKAPDARMSGQK